MKFELISVNALKTEPYTCPVPLVEVKEIELAVVLFKYISKAVLEELIFLFIVPGIRLLKSRLLSEVVSIIRLEIVELINLLFELLYVLNMLKEEFVNWLIELSFAVKYKLDMSVTERLISKPFVLEFMK